MKITIVENRSTLGAAAAEHAAAVLRNAIQEQGSARIIAASAASQLEFLDALVQKPGIDWSRIELFHLDEYIGLPMTHPASFCRFLQDRLISRTGIERYHFLNGLDNTADVIRRASEAIRSQPIDVAFIGIGENGHIAFNDPPADFDTEEPYIVVTLDDACRQQQVAEGWFSSLDEVPTRAVSMSVRQILKSKEILAMVPGERKASAVKACFTGKISPMTPASILRTHQNATVYLDQQSAALLTPADLSVTQDAG
ncbi:MAG TPA: glucosamine-6-phosphate deaminase [Bryobacteraceae bacterium]